MGAAHGPPGETTRVGLFWRAGGGQLSRASEAQELPQPQKHEKQRWYRIVRTQFKYGKDWEARQLIKDHLRPATVASGAGEPVMEFHNQTGPWHETLIWAMPEGPAEMEWALSPDFTKWFAALAKLEGGTDKSLGRHDQVHGLGRTRRNRPRA